MGGINVIQIVLLLLILFALSRAILRFKGKQINLGEFIFWCAIWVIVGFLVIVPQTTDILARVMGVGRGVDAIIYIGMALVFYLMFRLYVKVDHMDQEITKVVREVAIKKSSKKIKK